MITPHVTIPYVLPISPGGGRGAGVTVRRTVAGCGVGVADAPVGAADGEAPGGAAAIVGGLAVAICVAEVADWKTLDGGKLALTSIPASRMMQINPAIRNLGRASM